MANIDPAIAGLVLEAVSDDDFEIFSQALLGQVIGLELEPTGGMHDGGQDGFFRPVKGRPTHFVQISTQPGVKAKILKTIGRQRAVGRTVEDLTYVSNRNLPNRDILEGDIEKETGVGIRIRDRRWITMQIQRDDKASQLFVDRFAPLVHSTLRLGGMAGAGMAWYWRIWTMRGSMRRAFCAELKGGKSPSRCTIVSRRLPMALFKSPMFAIFIFP